jgi:hypothetical protein
MNLLERVRFDFVGQKDLLHAFHLDEYIVRICHLFSYARLRAIQQILQKLTTQKTVPQRSTGTPIHTCL